MPLLDEYLEFLAGRCRPNTALAVAYDLKVFFTVVAKPPRRVRPVDVLAFMTAQRAGGEGHQPGIIQRAEAPVDGQPTERRGGVGRVRSRSLGHRKMRLPGASASLS